jgi:hypothetical protein
MLLASNTAQADLRFTTRIEVRSIATAEPLEPAVAMAATMMLRVMPSGETVTFINNKGARVEIVKAAGSMLKAGTVMIGRDATMAVVDAENKTYWTLAAPPAGIFPPGIEPEMKYRRTGEFETIAGLRAERVTFSQTTPLPFTPAPRFPTSLVVEGEIWVTDQYKSYGATMIRTLSALGTLLAGVPEGIIVRQTMRSAQFGYEVEHTLSDLVEAPLAPSLFEIPDGFRRVPAPLTIPRPVPAQ